jgi:protein-tyrosine phosphatase
VPIIEDPINIYAKGLLEAAQILKKFLETNKTVFVHCTAGFSRCTTLIVFYLCFYSKANDLKNPN